MTRPTRWLLAVLAADVLLLWSVGELFGGSGLAATGGVIGVTAVVWWKSYGTATRRREADLTARALADHRDPGPADRAAVDARAEQVLATPRSDEWLPAVLLLALAAACVVMAVVRGDVSVALPAVLLVPAAVLAWVVVRRRLLAASRWLDDPPYDRTTS